VPHTAPEGATACTSIDNCAGGRKMDGDLRVGGRLCAVLIAAFWFAPVGASAETMRCSHQFPPQHHVTGLIERWAADVGRLTKGRIDVDLIGDAKLFKPEDNILAVAKGEVECAFSLNYQWARKLPLMYATLAPFMMQSPNIPQGWTNSGAAHLLEARMRDKGVQSVAWLFQTNQSVITSNDRHILRPVDFDGLRMRGHTPAFDETLKQLGVETVPLHASQLYEAMRTGVIDAAITDVAVAVSRRFYEQQDHMVVLPMVSAYVSGYVTPQWYDLLDDDLKEAFRQAGESAMRLSVNVSQAAAAAAPAALRDHGVDVHVASAEEIEVLREALQPYFLDLFLEEAGEDGRKLLDLIRELE
jgi:TRAP-type C4-dicarboxylate transport system substrate-binding protein